MTALVYMELWAHASNGKVHSSHAGTALDEVAYTMEENARLERYSSLRKPRCPFCTSFVLLLLPLPVRVNSYERPSNIVAVFLSTALEDSLLLFFLVLFLQWTTEIGGWFVAATQPRNANLVASYSARVKVRLGAYLSNSC